MTTLEVGLLVLAIVAGAVAAISGFGIGSLLTPALAVSTGIRAAVAVVALPHALATATRLWALRDAIDVPVLRSFGIASALGGLAGAALQGFLASPALSVVLGLLLILAGALQLTGIGRRLAISGPSATAAGLAAGVFGGLVGNQGGIRSAALLHAGLSPRTLVATATATAMLVDVARVPIYFLTSYDAIAANVRLLAILSVGVVVGTFFGAPILRGLPEPLFRRLVSIVLIAVGVLLLVGSPA
ncbi:MAG TPA: TSUP family transporter [Candidatus Limnocylindrales bacterium]|nr:TSUP family transporter [Candidatus Limnocylindrales bacterium]